MEETKKKLREITNYESRIVINNSSTQDLNELEKTQINAEKLKVAQLQHEGIED